MFTVFAHEGEEHAEKVQSFWHNLNDPLPAILLISGLVIVFAAIAVYFLSRSNYKHLKKEGNSNK